MQSKFEMTDNLRVLARQKLRHEYGHLIAARILGFQTGEVVLKLFPENGEHAAWAELFISTPLRTVAEIVDFLERRIVVLFGGAMAEASSAADVGEDYVEQHSFKSEGGARDAGKIHEFIAVHQNISRPDYMDTVDLSAGRDSLYSTLRLRAASLVRDEFELIDALAADHVRKLVPVTRGWAWGLCKEDVDSLPKIVARFS